MELYSKGKNYTLYCGNMLNMLDVIAPNSIDSIANAPYEPRESEDYDYDCDL